MYAQFSSCVYGGCVLQLSTASPLHWQAKISICPIETDLSKSVSHTAADQSTLVSYTNSSSKEEEEDLHIDVILDKPLWHLISLSGFSTDL